MTITTHNLQTRKPRLRDVGISALGDIAENCQSIWTLPPASESWTPASLHAHINTKVIQNQVKVPIICRENSMEMATLSPLFKHLDSCSIAFSKKPLIQVAISTKVKAGLHNSLIHNDSKFLYKPIRNIVFKTVSSFKFPTTVGIHLLVVLWTT